MLSIHLVFLFLLLRWSLSYRMPDFQMMEVNLGEDVGLGSDSDMDPETVQKVLDGVERGNRESIYFYGLMKMYGIKVPQDKVIAASMFERAARLGHVEATTAFGMMLMHGEGMENGINIPKAITFFKQGVSLGDMNAHWLLGKLLLEGNDAGPAEQKEAFELLSRAAEENVMQAQHLLGVLYEYGIGTEVSWENAGIWYRRASGQDYWESTYHLALMYAYGRLPQDFKKALALLERAARAEHAPSIYYMGVFKMRGYGCEPDYERAINWFERAAGMGDFRVNEMATTAAAELKALMLKAQKVNEGIIERYEEMGQDY